MRRIEIAPSILAADFTDLKKELKMLETAEVERIHLDVMDGHFVPNITFGPPLIHCIDDVTDLFLEAHLMIFEPQKYLKAFKNAGSDIIIIHKEVLANPRPLLEEIKGMGIQAGISINPGTPWQEIKDVLAIVDMVLIMTVNPGFGGQKYIADAALKMQDMAEYISNAGFKQEIDIGIDGGIDPETIKDAAAKGANVFIAGSSIFNADDPIQRIKELRKAATDV
ncbi:MAG: ribulose-phosphate 3-epimerase [bacterium]|nr:ribulose-phosphate 3-epimerase [bacterium]